MRIALVSDVHGNWEALQSVLAHARHQRVDRFLGIGDWVGGAGSPNQVLQWLESGRVEAIAGNYDLAVLEVPARLQAWADGEPPSRWKLAAWTYDRLTEEGREQLGRMPTWLRVNAAGRRLLVVHIAPDSEEEGLEANTCASRFRKLARGVDADVVIVGHTHAPLSRKSGGVWFVNPGSVGRPRDGEPLADYAILTLGPRRVQVRHYRLPYSGQPAERAQSDGVTSEGDTQTSATEPPDTYTAHRAAALELARSCEFEEQHSRQVTRLALRLFDELQAVHGLGPTERFWLECAGLLHDIGLVEGPDGHHKASLRLILESPLLLFAGTERLIIANVARYHRAALPGEQHRHFARLKPTARRAVRFLAAMLRVADGLDYSHQSVVADLVCLPSRHAVLVRCTVSAEAEVERQRALKKSDLFVDAFKRQLTVECVGQ